MLNVQGIAPPAVDIVYQETGEELEMKMHFHNSYEIIYITEGSAQFEINSRIYEVKRDDIIFINYLESHKLRVTGCPYKRYFILMNQDYFKSVIDEPVLASIFKHRPDRFRHVISLAPGKSVKILDVVRTLHEEVLKKNEFWELYLEASVKELFIYLYRNYREHFPLAMLNNSMNMVLQIQKYIEEHYAEKIDLDGMSKLFYADKYYISHLFKKVTGFSFKEYLILQRISKAKDLLFYTDDNITNIGILSGFNNVNHFIRIFKKFEGITPYQYKKKFCR